MGGEVTDRKEHVYIQIAVNNDFRQNGSAGRQQEAEMTVGCD